MLLVNPPSTKVRAKSRQADHATGAEGLCPEPRALRLSAPLCLSFPPERCCEHPSARSPQTCLALALWAGAHRPALLLGAGLGWSEGLVLSGRCLLVCRCVVLAP